MLLTQASQATQEEGIEPPGQTLKKAILELARPVCPVEILPAGLCAEAAGMIVSE
jgi:hypothetical protein